VSGPQKPLAILTVKYFIGQGIRAPLSLKERLVSKTFCGISTNLTRPDVLVEIYTPDIAENFHASDKRLQVVAIVSISLRC
jgi:hypothetical protein